MTSLSTPQFGPQVQVGAVVASSEVKPCHHETHTEDAVQWEGEQRLGGQLGDVGNTSDSCDQKGLLLAWLSPRPVPATPKLSIGRCSRFTTHFQTVCLFWKMTWCSHSPPSPPFWKIQKSRFKIDAFLIDIAILRLSDVFTFKNSAEGCWGDVWMEFWPVVWFVYDEQVGSEDGFMGQFWP